METGRNNLLEALKQVERRTENSASGWRLLLYALILVPLASVILYALFERMWWHPLVVGMALYAVMLCWASISFNRSYRAAVRQRIDQSGLYARLATGELIEDPTPLKVPWPWRTLLPGNSAGASLATVVHRVAWNLDWYLTPPKTYWRLIWFYIPFATCASVALIVSLIAATIFNVSLGANAQLPDAVSFLLSLLLIVPINQTGTLVTLTLLVSPLPFVFHRRQIWTEELVRHLRERLQA